MNAPMRRGACPRLSEPMATGDGLLARLIPSGATIGFDALSRLCTAARSHGNGIIEVTSRGSIQVRGLSAASAPAFAATVGALEIDCGDVIPVLAHPLSGLDPQETFDVAALTGALRQRLAMSPLAQRLSAKVSVIVDGGGALNLDEIGADVRLRAVVERGRILFHVALAGDSSTAAPLAAVSPVHAAECVARLLGVLADSAPQARMRVALADRGVSAFADAVADLALPAPQPATAAPARPIGIHKLRAGRVAIGLGLPFGHSDCETLGRLFDAAKRAGASGLRTAPGRALLLPGLSPAAAQEVSAQAGALGFIVDADDPRCRVIACAGSPVCASGQFPSRALAPAIAQSVRGMLNGRDVIHVSGCSKGCAHPAPAAFAVFGRDGICDIQVNGTLSHSVTVDDLPMRIAHVVQAYREPERG